MNLTSGVSGMPFVKKIRNNAIIEANETKKSFISIIRNTKKLNCLRKASNPGQRYPNITFFSLLLVHEWKRFFMLHFKLHTFIFICFLNLQISDFKLVSFGASFAGFLAGCLWGQFKVVSNFKFVEIKVWYFDKKLRKLSWNFYSL